MTNDIVPSNDHVSIVLNMKYSDVFHLINLMTLLRVYDNITIVHICDHIFSHLMTRYSGRATPLVTRYD